MIELEPTMLLPALAMITSHIGQVMTASTSYNEPYRLSGARVERRLAATPAADAAGCSRLMGEDDAGTLARLADVAHAMRDVSDELDAARNRSSWQHF